MRAMLEGKVVGVESREYNKRDGSRGVSHAFFVRQTGDSDRYAADKIEFDPETITVAEGDELRVVVLIRARAYKGRDGEPFVRMTAWAVEVESAKLRVAV